MQTLRDWLVRAAPDLSPWPGQRLELPMRDGSGDRLLAMLHRPAAGPGAAGGADSGVRADRPLVLLIHGLTGCEDSAYIRAGARHWLGRGHPVLRLNLRGAGPSRPTCLLHYHAGRSDDLRDALAALAALPALAGALSAGGLIAVGYSLGGNMLLKYLGEEGAAAPFMAAASVSAPIDLAATTRRIQAPRNALYHRYILSRMKAEALAPVSALDGGMREAVRAARSIYAYDDAVVAPLNGFAGADDYYRKCMARRFLADIRVPTLLVHARNDPWIRPAPYLEFDWQANPALTPLLPQGGGHVGFHGRGAITPWHDRAIAAFVDGI